jgi:hypothetical protein
LESTFFTWETLATVGGATAVVTVIVAVIEKLFGPGLNERIRNAVIALSSIALLVAGALSVGGATWETYVLAVVNGLVVSLAVLRLSDITVPRLINRAKGEPVEYSE